MKSEILGIFWFILRILYMFYVTLFYKWITHIIKSSKYVQLLQR